LLPWPVTIPPAERRVPMEAYLDDLPADGGDSGILNMALDGLLQVVRNNWRLNPPKAALDATAEYISDEDKVARFYAEWFETGENDTDPNGPMNTRELRRYFALWSDEPEKYCIGPHAFTKETRRIFGARCRLGGGRWHVVVDLRPKAVARDAYFAHVKRKQEKDGGHED